MTRHLIVWFLSALCLFGQSIPPKRQAKWLHVATGAHLTMALADGLSSWKQPEGNALLATNGRFQERGAQRMGLISVGIVAASYTIGHFRPGWKKHLAVFNLSMAGVHGGVTAYNLRTNPHFK